MNYLEIHSELKKDYQNISPNLKSALVLSLDYFPHPTPSHPTFPLKFNRIAKYARGQDYHIYFQNFLNDLKQYIIDNFSGPVTFAWTDIGPVLERDLAQQASLGWIGKNTCLIHPKHGSFSFIGEILTSLEIESTEQKLPLIHDFCGNCTRCIDACPTGAIEKPKVLNATKCISYWTIESKEPAPLDLRAKLKDWLFGCDICQDVCPWNEKAFTAKKINESHSSLEEVENELRWLLTTSNKTIDKLLKDSPFSRAGGRNLKKNAIIVAANLKIKSLRPDIQKLAEIDRYAELVEWALKELK
jgi:epoxyqueuosine reductase